VKCGQHDLEPFDMAVGQYLVSFRPFVSLAVAVLVIVLLVVVRLVL
jgi:hypothetical protein